MGVEIIRGPRAMPIDPLRGRTIAVLGYGNQGRAHALNLRDSGLAVVVGNREGGAGWRRAERDGFDPRKLPDAVAMSDLVILALPDESQPEIYRKRIAGSLKPDATIGFLHGFAIRYGLIEPPPDAGVVLVAPKGPGQTLRDRFVRGHGLPCLVAVHQESPGSDARAIALAWAGSIGASRAGVIMTTFADETETDLFGEQGVLCGGMTSLILAAFETLVEAGYPPELAYLECCHEVKQVADLVYAGGPAAMTRAISNTAEFGAYAAGPRIIDENVRATMRELLQSIRNGAFARMLREDHAAGFPWFEQQRQVLARHPIEPAGETVRSLMPWLTEADDDPHAE